MSIFGKIKGILFDEEEPTEQIKITPEMRNDDTPSREVVVNKPKEIKPEREVVEPKKETNPISERELFKKDDSFPFFDFDEEEFESAKPAPKAEVKKEEPVKKSFIAPPSEPKFSQDYEIHTKTKKSVDYGNYVKTVVTETTEKKKFKPSPIISPVYGILNKDYQKEDIIKKTELLDMDVQKVRDKAFGERAKEEKIKPRTTFYEETVTVTTPTSSETEKITKSIDELLDETDEIAIPKLAEEKLPPIPESLEENLPEEYEEEIKTEHEIDEKEDTLENDLFDLIDKMYDSKEDE